MPDPAPPQQRGANMFANNPDGSPKSKNAPAPPNYAGAAEQTANASQHATNQQTQANRPDINTPFGFQNWTQGPDGQWSLSSGLNGGLGAAAGSLGGQAQDAMSHPLDMSGLPQVDSGAGARDQAIQASYGQAASRLDPQWKQREEQERSQLANQGLDPNSEAGRNAMTQFGQSRNDAYGGAMNSAILHGDQAGNTVFHNSMMARQNALGEALKKRGLPLEEMQAMMGLMGTPGFHSAGVGATPDYLGAAGLQDSANWRNFDFENKQRTDAMSGMGDLLGMFSKIPKLL